MDDFELRNDNLFDRESRFPRNNEPAVPNTAQLNSAARNSAPVSDQNGAWTPVAGNNIQLPVGGEPGKPFVGPDGNVYCVADSTPTMQPLAQSSMNAIPTPSSIIQMAPIVQPIALVPYASQNQPLLQYDPNSRPPQEVETIYKRKPYPLICALMAVLSIVGILFAIVFNVLSKTETGSISVSGIDALMSFFSALGIGNYNGVYLTSVMQPLGATVGDMFAANFGNALAVCLIPIMEIVMILTYLYIIGKYFYCLVIGKSPRNFSIASVILLIAALCNLFCIYSVAKILDANASFSGLFGGSEVVGIGLSVYATLAIAVLTLILPYCTNGKAYIVDNAKDNQVFIIA